MHKQTQLSRALRKVLAPKAPPRPVLKPPLSDEFLKAEKLMVEEAYRRGIPTVMVHHPETGEALWLKTSAILQHSATLRL